MRLRQFAEGMLWVGRSSAPDDFIGLDEYATLPEEYIVRKGLTEGLQQFLKAVGGEEFRFVAPRSGDGRLLCEVGKERAPFAATASAGMKALARLYFWMQKMQHATLVSVDDFDAGTRGVRGLSFHSLTSKSDFTNSCLSKTCRSSIFSPSPM